MLVRKILLYNRSPHINDNSSQAERRSRISADDSSGRDRDRPMIFLMLVVPAAVLLSAIVVAEESMAWHTLFGSKKECVQFFKMW
jgi:hypothetical protein